MCDGDSRRSYDDELENKLRRSRELETVVLPNERLVHGTCGANGASWIVRDRPRTVPSALMAIKEVAVGEGVYFVEGEEVDYRITILKVVKK